MKRHPTFEQLREHRELPVLNPAMGRRFVISLRDWQGALWAVRVLPAAPLPVDKFNPFVQKHRLLSRPVIEEWLDRLRLVQARLSGPSARTSR
jgi:hypothetical protein